MKMEKKPAHVVIVEMIRETIGMISRDEPLENEELKVATMMGMLAAEFEMLKRMIIPEKHRDEVITSLRQIRKNCSLENVNKFFPDLAFLAILLSLKQKE